MIWNGSLRDIVSMVASRSPDHSATVCSFSRSQLRSAREPPAMITSAEKSKSSIEAMMSPADLAGSTQRLLGGLAQRQHRQAGDQRAGHHVVGRRDWRAGLLDQDRRDERRETAEHDDRDRNADRYQGRALAGRE